MALLNKSDVRQAGRIESNEFDEEIDRLINIVTARAERYLARRLTLATWTEYHDGGGDRVVVNNAPWTAVSSLVEGYPNNTRTITVSGNVRTEDEHKTAGEVILYNNEATFAAGEAGVKVIYTGGYTDSNVPYDLQRALIQQVLFELQHYDRIGIKDQSADGVSVTYDMMPSGFTLEVQRVLDGYRNLWRVVV